MLDHYTAAPSLTTLLLLSVCSGLVGCQREVANPGGVPAAASDKDVVADPAKRLRAAIAAEDWEAAQQLVPPALVADPTNPDLVTDAAKVAAMRGRRDDAAQLLVDAAALANYRPAQRVDFAVQALIEVGQLYKAIEFLRQVIEADPQDHQHRRVLVSFLAEAQRVEQIQPHFLSLIQSRNFDFPLLVGITETSSRRFGLSTVERLMELNPDDHRVRLGEAREMLDQHDAAAADAVLEDILQHHPDFAPAHALQGQVLSEQRRFAELTAWHDRAPIASDQYADYWLTLGDWAVERDEPQPAARAYWEATRRDPNNSAAWTRLAQTLRQLQTDSIEIGVSGNQLRSIDDRIAALLELREAYYNFTAGGRRSQRLATEVARLLMSLGRNWEAEAWSAAATTLNDDPSGDLAGLRQQVLQRIQADADWQSLRDQPALAVQLNHLPTLAIDGNIGSSAPVRQAVIPQPLTTDHLRLSDESQQWQIGSTGSKNNPTDAKLAALIRSTGVGGGAIDYDLDGWPDVLVMGAGGTMLANDSQPNELLRNLGDHFQKVTVNAGVGDRGYGQGVAVGDWNEDGFPDLFFANLGKNRLLRNNGDGSYTDCTERLNDGGAQQWTTCGAFADIDGDGISDLFATNYCQTVPDLDKACPNQAGVLGPCHPLKFPADEDQVFAGTSSGRFSDVTDRWIAKATPGRGLGIVAGALQANTLGIFVANDMSANAYYTAADDRAMRLTENAAAAGIAVDGRTLAQASMGIASSDFDGDGDLDLYVTGFGKEYNIYYEQVAPGLWKDETSRFDLVRPTLSMVGFGTEAIDMDNDGVDEIIVTNGHIGDFQEPDSLPYAQPLQLFRRNASGGFTLLQDDAWGEYFSTDHVGRALWTLDVNRDGRSDAMITHSYEPLKLLVNRTEDQNHHLAIKLVGTDCSRDAVGAVVRFRCDGRLRTLWALSGDGYMCSNERTLRAGLGTADKVSELTVTWPDGQIESIGTLTADKQYVIVQGQQQAFATE